MTVNINIEKGDLVRAVSKSWSGDFSVFTVTYVSSAGKGCESATNFFASSEFDFEILKKAPKPTPTQAGIYRYETNPENTRYLILTVGGKWYWLDFTDISAGNVLEEIGNVDVHVQQGLKLVLQHG